jgi:hypothetical protein
MMIKRYWKFYAEHDDGGCYLGAEGLFIGNDQEAIDEADRRANIYENETGGIIIKVVIESRGIVTH